MINLTQTEIDKIQIDEGILYFNFGETTETKVAPIRGGGEFTVKNTIRDIEYDGKMGKTKGLQVIDEQNATLKVTTLNASQDTISKAIAGCNMTGQIITNGEGGIIPASKYLTNVTLFAKTIDGEYKKITIYNALNEGDFTLGAKPKAEGEIGLEFIAHFDPMDSTKKLYKIEEVSAIAESSI